MVLRFVVIGNPISHSLSPVIHQAFADQFKLSIDYQRLCTDSSQLESVIHDFFSHDGVGLNITLPFKELVLNCVDEVREKAQQARAINTIGRDQYGRLWGDNTDGVGFIKDVTHNLGREFHRKKILITGAGGAVRGIMAPLLEQGPEQLIITNRTLEKATKLQAEFKHLGNIEVISLAQTVKLKAVDWVINSIPMGQTQAIIPSIQSVIGQSTEVYDLSYHLEGTPLCRWLSQAKGIKAFDGLGMLVEQAACAFMLWHEKTPDTLSVIRALNEQRCIKSEY